MQFKLGQRGIEMFSISELELQGATIGMAPMMGRKSAFENDLDVVYDWKPDLVLSLTQIDEMRRFKSDVLPERLIDKDIKWIHFPIQDFGVPSEEDAPLWIAIEQVLQMAVSQKARILIHCMGGCGRTGMVVLRMMCTLGESPNDAVCRLRAARDCAVETDAQMQWATNGQIRKM